MEGQIDEEYLSTEPERNSFTTPGRTSGAVRCKVAKRTYPWAATRHCLDEDIPVANMHRLLVAFPATAQESIRKTASLDAKEAIQPAEADGDTMIPKQPNASATQAPPSVSTLKNYTELTRGVKPTVQRMHNSYKEYRNEWPGVAAMAPVPTNMQLSELSGRHHISYQTTGFTGMSTVDQVKVLQILNGMNGHASPVARGLGETTWNGWSPRDSAWHHAITHATSLPGLSGLLGMRTVDQGNILATQQNGNDWYASTDARGLGPTISPFSNGWTSRDSAWYPTITQVTSLPGMRTADQGSILETQQNGKSGYASTVARDPCQTTTTIRPCRKRLHETMDTPVDGTTGRTGRWTTEEVEIDWTTERKGKWTAEEDEKLLRAAEKFAVTRWKTIAELIPGRTKKQCWNRWQYALDPSIVRMTERTGKWLTEEDDQLLGAVEKHNGKNWDAISTLVPSRTKRQCMDRWHKCKAWSPA
jgi:hypothetical protein